MSELIQELLPYAKGFAGMYLIGNLIAGVLSVAITIYVFKSIMKRRREFDRNFKNRWK